MLSSMALVIRVSIKFIFPDRCAFTELPSVSISTLVIDHGSVNPKASVNISILLIWDTMEI